MKTTVSAKPADIEKKWLLIDAENLVVGRLASIIANRLRGNDKVKFTGRKLTQKLYYRHTGYPGGIKEIRADKVLDGRFPERVLEKAVERMVPRGPLGRQQMRNLRIFKGTDHPHGAQNPEVLDVGAMNRKNKVGA